MSKDLFPDAGNKVGQDLQLKDEIASLRFDLENATDSRKLAQETLYRERDRFNGMIYRRDLEIGRLQQLHDCKPVLVRDLAEILGRAVTDVMSAFIVAGIAPHSPNMAVSGEDALAVAAVLKQQRQDCEPDAWMDADGDLYATEPDKNWCPPHTSLYAFPPKREPLSDEQIDELHIKHTFSETGPYEIDFARAIERAHGIGGQS